MQGGGAPPTTAGAEGLPSLPGALPDGGGQADGGSPPSPSTVSPAVPQPVRENIAAEVPVAAVRVRSSKMSRFLSGLWEYLLRLTWLFCGVLILRLVFTNGGVVDFYAKRGRLDLKQKELLSIKSENQEILAEIDKIKNSPEYQKRLVRKHLEFIAPDEFLILFAKEGVRRGH